MYISEKIKDALFGDTPLVGWRQVKDPSKSQLDANIVSSTSGKMFQDAHPYITLDNIFSVSPRFEDYVYEAWTSDPYIIGQKVSKGGKDWIAILASTNQDPEAVSSTFWSEWTYGNQKSEWLKEKTRGYLTQVFDDILDSKKWNQTASSILNEAPLYNGSQYDDEVTKSRGKVAGFEIQVARGMSVLSRIDRIGLQFTEVGDVTIELHHSSNSAAINSQIITVTEANTVEWFDLGWEVPYMSAYDAGGIWTIEYNQNDVNGNAVNKTVNYQSYKCHDYFRVSPYTVDVADKDNISKRSYEYNSNLGMNLIVSTYCDYTEFFIRQKNLFSTVIQKLVAIKFLEEIALNADSRINKNISSKQVLYLLNGDDRAERRGGLKFEYEQAIKALIIDTEGIDSICLPCAKRGITWGTT